MISRRTKTFCLSAVTLAIILIFCGCGKKTAVPSGPNIILITIDTLRADHLSCYGYHRQTSPFIDSIAGESVVFTNACSTSSWTAPSMASIFTGHYPRSHGVLHGVARGPKAAVTGQEMLVKDFLTIAEALKTAGYTTFGVSTNGHISRGTGFSQGFDYFATHWFMKSPAPNSSVKKWLKHIRTASRYFLWIHYFDPHNPYAPRMPWVKNYTIQSGSYSKWTREVMANPKEYIENIKKDPRALHTLIDRYDSEINYCDYHIKNLLELLPPDPNTLIVITADHGEAFIDHGQLLHGGTLFEEEILVPLIIKLPANRKAVKTIHQPVSNRSIFATIMDLAGPDKDREIPGVSLMPLISASSDNPPGEVFFELDWLGWGKGIRYENWKFIVSGRENKELFLFDLQADPGEKRNLFPEMPGKVKLLDSLLRQWIDAHPEFKAPMIKKDIDPDRENKLKTLGYL
jgi:arylsulfatase